MAEGQQQEPFEDMMNRLRVVKEKAEQFSSEIKETFDIANRAIGRSAQRNPRTSFQAPVSLGAQATTFYPGAESFWPTPQSPYESSISYAAHPTTQTIPPSYTLHHEALPLDKADEFTDCGEDYATYSFEPQYAARTTQPASPYESDVGLYLERFARRVRSHMISTTTAESNQRMADDALAMSVACASLAEEALKKATGVERPPIECWGCSNHPNMSIRADRFHRFFDCPRKASDPTVREAGEAKLREFMEERRARRLQRKQRPTNLYGPVNNVTTEAEAMAAGHHSVVAASLIATIAHTETSPEVRMACYKELAEKLSNAPTTVLHTGTKRSPDPVDTNPKDPKFAPGPNPQVRFHFHFMPESDNFASMTRCNSHIIYLEKMN
jgi:hypothetical protein